MKSPRFYFSIFNIIYTYYIKRRKEGELTAHNWQKLKSRFLTSPCRQTYRVEAVCLEIANYALEITIFVNM